MRLTDIRWTEDRVEHIARHGVTPEEAEEACFRHPFIRRARRKKDMLYYAYGRTLAGRYLFVVFRYLGGEQAIVITARDMNEAERRAYRKRRSP